MVEIECLLNIKKDGQNYLNPAKIILLQKIASLGSLRSAAKEMEISYQHAWNMIDEMNRLAPEPLVIKQRGGTAGGGASVSSYGSKILNEYSIIKQQLDKTINQIKVEIGM
jgi:molybdate transport system regulatory protein